jgi:excisionase family DNA binding protein
MTAPEVSAYLKINIETLYRMAKARTIPCFRIFSDYRFNRETIYHWCLRQDTPQQRPVAKRRGPKPREKK